MIQVSSTLHGEPRSLFSWLCAIGSAWTFLFWGSGWTDSTQPSAALLTSFSHSVSLSRDAADLVLRCQPIGVSSPCLLGGDMGQGRPAPLSAGSGRLGVEGAGRQGCEGWWGLQMWGGGRAEHTRHGEGQRGAQEAHMAESRAVSLRRVTCLITSVTGKTFCFPAMVKDRHGEGLPAGHRATRSHLPPTKPATGPRPPHTHTYTPAIVGQSASLGIVFSQLRAHPPCTEHGEAT